MHLFIYRHDHFSDRLNDLSKRPPFKTARHAAWQHIFADGRRFIPDRYTDKPFSEHSCLQLLRCTFCRAQLWTAFLQKEYPHRFRHPVCFDHPVHYVLKAALLFWCADRFRTGRTDVCSGLQTRYYLIHQTSASDLTETKKTAAYYHLVHGCFFHFILS